MSSNLISVDKFQFDDLKRYILDFCKSKNSQTNYDPSVVKTYFDDRQVECTITEISKLIEQKRWLKQVEQEYSSLQNEFCHNQNRERNLDPVFIYFYVIFTYYRRQKNFTKMEEFYKEGLMEFKDYPIYNHIDLLCKANLPINFDKLEDLIRQSIKNQNKYPQLKQQEGVIHHYCEMVAIYYERNLDLKHKDEAKKQIKDALEKVDNLIKENENKNKGNQVQLNPTINSISEYIEYFSKQDLKNYDKYYVTKGRLLALNQQYSQALVSINKGISLVYDSDNPNKSTIDSYKLIANNISLIKAYDTSLENYESLRSIKTDNFKVISLMTAVLSFVLGSVQIFATVKSPVEIVTYLVAFLGLILILLGICLLGVSLVMKDCSKKEKKFIAGLIVLGVILLICILIPQFVEYFKLKNESV